MEMQTWIKKTPSHQPYLLWTFKSLSASHMCIHTGFEVYQIRGSGWLSSWLRNKLTFPLRTRVNPRFTSFYVHFLLLGVQNMLQRPFSSHVSIQGSHFSVPSPLCYHAKKHAVLPLKVTPYHFHASFEKVTIMILASPQCQPIQPIS